MKVIFLDHDGVICLSTEWGGRYKKQKKWGGRKLSMTSHEIPVEYRFDNFNKKAVKVLNEILKETNAEIVVSSDWKKHANLEEIGEYYESQGISKKPISFTPDLNHCTNYDETFQWIRQWTSEQSRSLEIKQYLTNHPEITKWVAIDDLNMGKTGLLYYGMEFDHDWGLENFVWTPKENEGIKQLGLKDKVIKILEN